MKRLFALVFLAFTIPVNATPLEDLNRTFKVAMIKYADIRTASDMCDLPAGEWVSYKARVLDSLMLDPKIDILKADRDMDRFYELQRGSRGSLCSESQRALFRAHVDGVDRDISYLREVVIKAR